ncbi:MAG: hypothetical protein IT457_04260 [Planctomycetes bacterium]|nr:hypothetical protein [Planctomycetota bacterium]
MPTIPRYLLFLSALTILAGGFSLATARDPISRIERLDARFVRLSFSADDPPPVAACSETRTISKFSCLNKTCPVGSLCTTNWQSVDDEWCEANCLEGGSCCGYEVIINAQCKCRTTDVQSSTDCGPCGHSYMPHSQWIALP